MVQQEAFIGFSYGDRHSSEFGILRTSKSNRHDSLFLSTVDVTTNLSTVDGTYYWGSKFQSRTISVSFAFYGLNEKQLSSIKEFFGGKQIRPLIFDEFPNRVWSAKLGGTSIMKHLCFENEKERYYCGEGEFSFSVYYPFARSRYQYLEDYVDNVVPKNIESDFVNELKNYIENKNNSINMAIDFDEWLTRYSFLKQSDFWFEDIDVIPSKKEYGFYNEGSYLIRNIGDIEMPFKMYFPINENPQNFHIKCNNKEIVLSNIIAKGQDKYIVLDSYALTINGCDENYQKTKNLYNNKISKGELFMLPIGEITLEANIEGILDFNYLYI